MSLFQIALKLLEFLKRIRKKSGLFNFSPPNPPHQGRALRDRAVFTDVFSYWWFCSKALS